MEKADDWVWIVDHTVQIGELKCMLIVAFRLGVWQPQEDRTLTYEDVQLMGLWPVRTSTGEIVDGQLESAIARTGLPRLIISDDGRDLHRGLERVPGRHGEVVWIYDIKHKTGCSAETGVGTRSGVDGVRDASQPDEAAGVSTELAFCNPPQQRGKARYMSVDKLVAWGGKVLQWLDEPRPTGRKLDADRIEEKLGWLRDYREPLPSMGTGDAGDRNG